MRPSDKIRKKSQLYRNDPKNQVRVMSKKIFKDNIDMIRSLPHYDFYWTGNLFDNVGKQCQVLSVCVNDEVIQFDFL